MVKKVNIITSLCGAGLEREAILLRALLSNNGIDATFIHYTGGPNEPMNLADLNISLEVICPQTLSLAKENWYAPNSEWYPSIYDQHLPRINKFICKTKDCYRIWSEKVGADRCVYTSFEARDLYRPEIPREDIFLHVAGKAHLKGTESVIAAWQLHPGILPPLTVVASNQEFKDQIYQNPSGIAHFSHVKDEELICLMNKSRFHILPSKYEGFGHVIHEALGCGGLVITTDAPPMNEVEGIVGIIPTSGRVSQRLAFLNHVDPEKICSSLINCGYNDKVYEYDSIRARSAFLANQHFFRKTFLGLVNAL